VSTLIARGLARTDAKDVRGRPSASGSEKQFLISSQLNYALQVMKKNINPLPKKSLILFFIGFTAIMCGCASHSKLPVPGTTVVATYRLADTDVGEAIYNTLRQSGIFMIGTGSGGYSDVHVSSTDAEKARAILKGLKSRGLSFQIVGSGLLILL
jgi:hypothetical protein